MYPVNDADVTNFYSKSKHFQDLTDQLSRTVKDPAKFQNKVSGYLKFFKVKYDQVTPDILNPDKFNRLLINNKIAKLNELQSFCKAFKEGNEILIFSIFYSFSSLMESCISKSLTQMTADEMKLAKSYCNLALVFCQKFQYTKT